MIEPARGGRHFFEGWLDKMSALPAVPELSEEVWDATCLVIICGEGQDVV